jgi:uncharacterized protein with PhoU and TrkA domain
MSDRTKSEIQNLSNDLQRLRDEVRLKMHLASMDVKKGFEDMEPEVRKLEQQTEELTQEQAVKVELAMKKAKKKLQDLRDRIAA